MSWKKHEKPHGFYVYELLDPRTNQPFYVGNILRDTRQADFSKVIYCKGIDHHSFGKNRHVESIEKQRTTCALKSQALKKKICQCGCGESLPYWRTQQAINQRGAHKFADIHFVGLNKGQRRLKINEMKALLLKGNK